MINILFIYISNLKTSFLTHRATLSGAVTFQCRQYVQLWSFPEFKTMLYIQFLLNSSPSPLLLLYIPIYNTLNQTLASLFQLNVLGK